MIRDTSLNAYYSEKKRFNTRTIKVFNLLKNTPNGLTDNEIMFKLGYHIPNMTRPRRNELYKKGLVVCCGKRRCTITNKVVMIWTAKDEVKEKNGRIEQYTKSRANRNIEVW